eukprot:1240689-Rhodomonas_salina.1
MAAGWNRALTRAWCWQTVYWAGGASNDEAVDANGIGAGESLVQGLYTLHLPTLRVERLGNTTRWDLRCSAPSPNGDALYFATKSAVWKMDLHSLEETWFCGSEEARAAQATCADVRFGGIRDMAMNGDGDRLFVCDTEQHRVFEIDVHRGSVEVLAGSGDWEQGSDGVGQAATLVQPVSIAWRRGVLYVLDISTIRQVDLHSREVSTVYNFRAHSAFADPRWNADTDQQGIVLRPGPVEISQILFLTTTNRGPDQTNERLHWQTGLEAYLVATDDGRLCASFFHRNMPGPGVVEDEWSPNLIGCLTPRGQRADISNTTFRLNRASDTGGAIG